MRCERCGKRDARVVGDRYERASDGQPAGRAIARQLLCRACSRQPEIDVVVDERDYPYVLASDACWCEVSLHAGVAIEWCPRHGRIQTPTRKTKE